MNLLQEPRQFDNSFGLAAWRGAPAVMAAPHAHNDVEINISTAELVYFSAGRTTTFPAGTPCAFWGAKPHQLVQAQEGADFAFATIPLALFMSWSVREVIGDRLLHGTQLLGQSSEITSIDQFERWARDLAGTRSIMRRAVELELEALLCRMAEGTWVETLPSGARTSRDLDRASRMASFIADHAREDIRLADVARTVHLHENRASAVFRSILGCSVNDYLGQFRVAEAQRLLLTTDLASSRVATEAGFQSLSSYHETFLRACGVTPTKWRLDHRAAVPES